MNIGVPAEPDMIRQVTLQLDNHLDIEENQGLINTSTATPNIDFYRYKIDFSIERI